MKQARSKDQLIEDMKSNDFMISTQAACDYLSSFGIHLKEIDFFTIFSDGKVTAKKLDGSEVNLS